jgi:hypothetical protein
VELDAFLLADAASIADGKLYVHGGGITRIAAPMFPWAHPQLAIVLRVRTNPGEFDGETALLQVRLIAPDGSFVVPAAEIPVPVPRQPVGVPDEEHFVQVTFSIAPVPFPQPGTYRLEIGLEGSVLRQASIPVIELPQAPGSAADLGA